MAKIAVSSDRSARLVRLAGRVGALGASQLLVSVATLLSVPILLRVLGPSLWLSIAIGQAIQEIARATVIWGWNSVGLSYIASMGASERAQYYLRSLLPRILLLGPVAVAVVVAALVIPMEDNLAAALIGLGGALYGLGGAWAFVGGDEPGRQFMWDAAPRAAAIVAGSAVVVAMPTAVAYALVVAAGQVVAVVGTFAVMNRRTAGTIRQRMGTAREAVDALRRGAPAFGAGILLVLRVSMPVIVTPLIAPAAAPMVALADKFLRWANTAMTPVLQALQVRVAASGLELPVRVRRATAAAVVVGPVLGIGTTVVSRFASGPMSDGAIVLSWGTSVFVGVIVCLVFAAGLIGNSVLAVMDRMSTVFRIAVGALVALAITFVPLTLWLGAEGAYLSVALVETYVVATQVAVLRRATRDAVAAV